MVLSDGAAGVYERRRGWVSLSLSLDCLVVAVGGSSFREVVFDFDFDLLTLEDCWGWGCSARAASSSSRKLRKVFCEARTRRTFWVDFVVRPESIHHQHACLSRSVGGETGPYSFPPLP